MCTYTLQWTWRRTHTPMCLHVSAHGQMSSHLQTSSLKKKKKGEKVPSPQSFTAFPNFITRTANESHFLFTFDLPLSPPPLRKKAGERKRQKERKQERLVGGEVKPDGWGWRWGGEERRGKMGGRRAPPPSLSISPLSLSFLFLLLSLAGGTWWPALCHVETLSASPFSPPRAAFQPPEAFQTTQRWRSSTVRVVFFFWFLFASSDIAAALNERKSAGGDEPGIQEEKTTQNIRRCQRSCPGAGIPSSRRTFFHIWRVEVDFSSVLVGGVGFRFCMISSAHNYSLMSF